MIDRLVQRGADLDAQSNNGWTALHVAVGQEHLEVVGQLLPAGADVEGTQPPFLGGENREQVSRTPRLISRSILTCRNLPSSSENTVPKPTQN